MDTFTQETFEITKLSRGDLIGFYTQEQIDRIPDSTMERIASKMADDYLNQLYWSSLEIIAEIVIEQQELDLDTPSQSGAE